jgi:hypothetical protein
MDSGASADKPTIMRYSIGERCLACRHNSKNQPAGTAFLHKGAPTKRIARPSCWLRA